MSTAAPEPRYERVYVWEIPVRLCHWLIFFSIVALTVTGIYIGNPFFTVNGEATHHFAMGSMKAVHFAAALVFAVAVFCRILWMFSGNAYARWSQFVPTTVSRLKGLGHTLAYYLFLSREPPTFIGHNPLAGAVYVLVFLLFFLMIATGLALASAGAHVDSVLSGFQFLIPWCGGLQMARFVHHVGMWLILGFAAHHVWSAYLIGMVEKNALLDSIFTGYKVLTPDDAKYARKNIEDGS
jgi:Ni/Fe-hydrogenase 1 B-type cytochrome subunit